MVVLVAVPCVEHLELEPLVRDLLVDLVLPQASTALVAAEAQGAQEQTPWLV